MHVIYVHVYCMSSMIIRRSVVYYYYTVRMKTRRKQNQKHRAPLEAGETL